MLRFFYASDFVILIHFSTYKSQAYFQNTTKHLAHHIMKMPRTLQLQCSYNGRSQTLTSL